MVKEYNLMEGRAELLGENQNLTILATCYCVCNWLLLYLLDEPFRVQTTTEDATGYKNVSVYCSRYEMHWHVEVPGSHLGESQLRYVCCWRYMPFPVQLILSLIERFDACPSQDEIQLLKILLGCLFFTVTASAADEHR
jgi:hypothetical protein